MPGYTWAITSGSLPNGLTLDPMRGIIAGTPTVTGSFKITVQATDSFSPANLAMQQLTLVVATPLTLVSSLRATKGSPFSATLVQGGTPPYSCVFGPPGSVLPPDVNLNGSNCTISGTPSAVGSYDFRNTATDSGNPPQTATSMLPIGIYVANPVEVTTAVLPPIVTSATSYSVTLSAASGYAPYSNWTVSSGSLPNGFTLGATTGTITGNPGGITGGPSTFSVTVQDSLGNVSPPRTYSTAALTPTTTTLSLPGVSSVFGHSVTLTASVTPVAATGKVTFYDGVSIIGTSSLTGGQATLSTTLTAQGAHSLKGYYLGSSVYAPSTSGAAAYKEISVRQVGFQPAVNYPTGGSPDSAVVGDFNGDGKMDIAVDAENGINILLGNGDGTFRPAAVLPANGALAVGDFDGDGKADLAATSAIGQTVSILLGNGDGTFQTPVAYAVSINPKRIALGDFNGDGIEDIALPGETDAGGQILLGNGDGTFYVAKSFGNTNDADGAGFGLVIADFNHDGLADIAVSTVLSRVVVFLGNGQGAFSQAGPSGPGGFGELSAADFNGDGLPDIATSAGVLPGNGDGTFGALLPFPAGVSGSPAAGDFNGDGKADLLLTGTGVSVLYGNGDGTFAAPVTFNAGTSPFSGAVADFNGDGLADIATANSGSNNVSVLLGVAPLAITTTTLPGGTATSAYAGAIVSVTGGIAPYTWSISSGSFPAGLSLNTSTGAIVGTPTVSGSFSFTVQVTDSSSPALVVSQAFTIGISAPTTGGGGAGGGGGGGGVPGGGGLSVTPTGLTFNVPLRGNPATQTLALSYEFSSENKFVFTSSFATDPALGWLSASPSSGTLMQTSMTGSQYVYGANVAVTVNPTGLNPGTYTGSVTLVSEGPPVTVPVTLIIAAQPAQFTVAPKALTFTYAQGDSTTPQPQSISVFSTPAGVSFTAASSNAGWLTVSGASQVTPQSVSVSVNSAGLAPGTYTGAVTISTGSGSSVDVPVTLTVLKPNPQLSISPAMEPLSVAQGGAPVTGQITVSNAGGGTLQFTAQASSEPSGWLQLNGIGTGSATFFSPESLGFTANPSGLSAGVYTGQITVSQTGSSSQAIVTVVFTVTKNAPSIQLSESGISVTAVVGGAQPPAQTFSVANSGTGSLNWTAQTSTLSGGNWLQATPALGTSASRQTGVPVSVLVSAAGLAPGQYYGSVNIASADAVNKQQTVSVVLNVVSSQAAPGVTVSTGGVILIGVAGGTALVPQMVTAFNPSSGAITYAASTFTASGSWLSVSPPSGAVSPGSNSLQIGADLSGLSAGVYSGTVQLAFGDGSSATIGVVAVASGGTESGSALRPRAVTACPAGKPSYLIPVFQQPVGQSAASMAAPQTVEVEVIDDCGNPVSAAGGGTVQVMFSSGDAGLDLHDVGLGIWEATWTPANPAAQVTLQVVAAEQGITLDPALNADASVTVTVPAATAASAPQPTGVANAASAAQAIPGVVAPGSYVAIYGTGLAGGGSPSAVSLPLPAMLTGTQLLLGGIPMPLLYAGAGQVNALVPQGLAPNASYPLMVVSGTTQSVPVALTVAELQPGIYTTGFLGSGAGIVTNAVSAQLIGASNPAHAGDYLTIYCTGLGALAGPNGELEPADGAAAPTSPIFRTKANVTVTIGGVNAPVQFAGLTATLAALYQVNVQVPAGVTPGGAIPVVITANDPQTGATAQSNPVTIAVQ